MASVTDDFQMPIMYQDLRNPNIGTLPMYNGYMYPGYLGGIQMRPILQNDQFTSQQSKKKGWVNALKTSGAILVGLLTLGALKGKAANLTLPKWLSNHSPNWFKKFFKPSP